MARLSNKKFQLFKSLKRRFQVQAPELTMADLTLSTGNPATILSLSGTAQAIVAIQPRSYTGFNIVGEISSSAGEGTPEHVCQVYYKTNAAGYTSDLAAKIAVLAARSGCSSTQLYTGTSAVAEAQITDANLVQDIDVSSESGATGA